MEKAIEEVESLENLPLPYDEKLPRKDLSPWCFEWALVMLLILVILKRLEINSWNA